MPKKTKLCYLISDIDKAVAFEWIVENIDLQKIELSFILFLPKASSCDLELYLKSKKIRVKRINLKDKSDFIPAVYTCFRTLIKWKIEIVHCHLRKATMIGLFAAKLLGLKKRIYTRHHSSFHHQYHPKAVKWDHFANSLATDIVAISENVKGILENKEEVPSHKIHLIHHGFDLGKFSEVSEERVNILRQKYLPANFKGEVVGIIGRYISWKGHQYAIESSREILIKYPNTHFIFANATGPDEIEIKSMLRDNIPSDRYTEIKFEKDLFALYQLFDLYIHCPINQSIEAFGQTYVEALAAGIPSIFTLSGIATEFIENGKNALVVPFMDSEALTNAAISLIENPELRLLLISNGKKSIEQFGIENFIKKLEALYLS